MTLVALGDSITLAGAGEIRDGSSPVPEDGSLGWVYGTTRRARAR